jgi:hypothetical protein
VKPCHNIQAFRIELLGSRIPGKILEKLGRRGDEILDKERIGPENLAELFEILLNITLTAKDSINFCALIACRSEQC